MDKQKYEKLSHSTPDMMDKNPKNDLEYKEVK